MIGLSVESSVRRMARKVNADIKTVDRALNKTLNQMAGGIKTEGARELSKVTGIAVNKLKKDMKIQRSNFRTLKAVVRARGRPYNLRSFGGRNKKAGGKVIGVNAKPWNSPHFFKRGFVLNVAGNPVVIREGKKLRGMYGPGLGRESQKQTIIKFYGKIGRRRFHKEFPKNLKFMTNRNRK